MCELSLVSPPHHPAQRHHKVSFPTEQAAQLSQTFQKSCSLLKRLHTRRMMRGGVGRHVLSGQAGHVSYGSHHLRLTWSFCLDESSRMSIVTCPVSYKSPPFRAVRQFSRRARCLRGPRCARRDHPRTAAGGPCTHRAKRLDLAVERRELLVVLLLERLVCRATAACVSHGYGCCATLQREGIWRWGTEQGGMGEKAHLGMALVGLSRLGGIAGNGGRAVYAMQCVV